MKRAKNYYNNLTRTTQQNFFQSVTKSCFANNKKFWNTVKPFLTNKGSLSDDSIKVNDDLVTEFANLFKIHYINIVENTSGHHQLSKEVQEILMRTTLLQKKSLKI